MVKGVRIWYSKEIEIHSGIRPAVTFRENWWVDHRGGLCKSRHYWGGIYKGVRQQFREIQNWDGYVLVRCSI